MAIRLNPYADKLRAFAEFAFDAERAFDHRGRWREWFGPRIGKAFDGKIIFEIGCFDAEFLCRIATRHPNTAFVGLDWKFKALHEGAARVTDLGLRNVALLRARAQDILKIFGQAEVDELWIFHPDPCDTPIELKNRLISEAFLLDAHLMLRDERSVIVLKTDHPGYYQWVLALLGLPQPEWFTPARQRYESEKTPDPEKPRVRAKDLVKPDTLPKLSEKVQASFEVTCNTADFWRDASAVSQRAFAGEATMFERRFIAKRLPIYFIELRRR